MAPIRDTVMAAVWLAKARASPSGRPAVRPVQKAATKESPAAVVSATWGIFTTLVWLTESREAATEPFSPMVMISLLTPRSPNQPATVFTSSMLMPLDTSISWPDMRAASCSLGDR